MDKKRERNTSDSKLSDKINDFLIISIASLFLGTLISFNIQTDKIIFADFFTLYNILMIFGIFGIFILSEKIMAYFLNLKIKLQFLESDRLSYNPESVLKDWKFPWWFILPFCLYFFSFGKVIWASIINFSAEPKPSRISRKRYYETEWDVAGIAFIGFLSALILGLIFKYYNYGSLSIFCNFLAITSILPFGHGAKIFFGSLPLWIFGIILLLFSLFFINLFSPFATIIFAGIFAFLGLIFFLWKKIMG